MTLTTVLAHSWGWDEVLYFTIPVVGALLWVRWIEQRARARKEAADGAGEPGPPADPNGEDGTANMTRPDES